MTAARSKLIPVAAAAGALMGLLAVGVAPVGSAPVEITTKAGKTVVGEVNEAGGKIEVTKATGEKVTLTAGEIKSRRPFSLDAARTEFAKKKGELKEDDREGRLALAGWAEDRGLIEQALDLYRDEAAKGNALAKAKVAQLEAATSAGPKDDKTGRKGERPASTEPAAGPAGPSAEPVTPEQIKVIRLREYGDSEEPKITCDKAVANTEAKYKDFSSNQNLKGRTRLEKARELFDEDPANLAPLNLETEPAVLADWHVRKIGVRAIQEILITRCATEKCHGGGPVKFQLNVAKGRSPEEALSIAYGNFEYVRRYQDGLLIRPKTPEASGLSTYGYSKKLKDEAGAKLTADVRKHPGVWKDPADRDWDRLIEWIGKFRSYEEAFAKPKPKEKDEAAK
jgi:hypothetical protein